MTVISVSHDNNWKGALMADLTKEERDKLPESDFAVPGKRELPMHDERHVKLAWDMVDRTADLTPEERSAARGHILRRAKELGVDTANWNKPHANHAESRKTIEIFRAGRHTSSDGTEISFSTGDLAASARAYDPAIHEAPIVVGHPQTDDPAYGWVKRLALSGESLFAEAAEVDPEFADLVRAGRFRKISASFYTPQSPQNPVPGVYYLRHVGFLGAQPPAVKGLKPVAFAGGEQGIIVLDLQPITDARRKKQMPNQAATGNFHERAEKKIAGHLRRIREHIMRKHGKDEADEAVPSHEIDALEEEARNSGEHERLQNERIGARASEGERAAFAESPEMLKRRQDLEKREADFAEKERTFKAAQEAARREANTAFCETLVKEGRLLPANKANALAILEFCASAPGKVSVEFGEGMDKQMLSPSEAVKMLLSSQPKVVSYGQAVNPGDTIPEGGDALREAKVAEFMEKHKGVSYRDAMIEVSKEFPQLFGLSVTKK
jgi:hypothetical protein